MQLSPEYVRALKGVGFSLDSLALYGIVLQGFGLLVSCAVAAVIFWRRSVERIALLGAFMLVSFGGRPSTMS
jgi:hypothetical protein